MVLRFLFFLGRLILRLRYRIRLINLEEVKSLRKEGKILFLPNHPAEIDPIILYCLLWPYFKPKTLVVEHFYFLKGAKFFMDLVGAIPIPSFGLSSSKWKMKRAEKAIEKVEREIEKGGNFLVYPSGQLRTTDHEVIGGNSLAHKLITETKGIRPVLIRTTGLWGSQFSRALTGTLPNFWSLIFKSIPTVLKNGIFFMPKRDLTIEFYIPGEALTKKTSKLELNQFLENWYNRYEIEGGKILDHEPLKRVSLSIYSQIIPEITAKKKSEKEKKDLTLSDEIKTRILKEVAEITGKNVDDLHEDQELASDLGMDSLDVAGLHAFLSQNFDIPKVLPGQLKTIYDLFETAAGQKELETDIAEPFLPKIKWKDDANRKDIAVLDGDSLIEVFLKNSKARSSEDACGDELRGVLSYRKVKISLLLLADKFRKLEGQYVGILLPSSVGAYLCILATLLAKKIPVMLNWTVGKRSLEHCAEVTNLKTILTSTRFLDRLEDVDFGAIEEKLLMLEKLRLEVSLKDKLWALGRSMRSSRSLMSLFGVSGIKKEDTAVVLFTSGTEALPKGVPLTHENILSNIRNAVPCAKLYPNDVVFGVLPPFHSFGFTVTGILPLLAGLKVFYAPDPTDSVHIAKMIEATSSTVLCLAPSFYRNLFKVYKPGQLDSLRLLVTGAESAPEELFKEAEKLNIKMIEGYGITECSPMVSIGRENEPHLGVGSPILNVELCVIHPETGQLKNQGEEGEICIYGSNVFKGYLTENKSPFIEINGKKWYRSGDIGYIDPEGHLFIKGRLKRFVKIGGEMMSLGAVEEELINAIKAQGKAPQDADEKPFLAVAAKEDQEKPILCCVTTISLSQDMLNNVLQEKGFGRIIKISKVIKVEEIPVTATGKVQIRTLQEIIAKDERSKS